MLLEIGVHETLQRARLERRIRAQHRLGHQVEPGGERELVGRHLASEGLATEVPEVALPPARLVDGPPGTPRASPSRGTSNSDSTAGVPRSPPHPPSAPRATRRARGHGGGVDPSRWRDLRRSCSMRIPTRGRPCSRERRGVPVHPRAHVSSRSRGYPRAGRSVGRPQRAQFQDGKGHRLLAGHRQPDDGTFGLVIVRVVRILPGRSRHTGGRHDRHRRRIPLAASSRRSQACRAARARVMTGLAAPPAARSPAGGGRAHGRASIWLFSHLHRDQLQALPNLQEEHTLSHLSDGPHRHAVRLVETHSSPVTRSSSF